MSTYYIVGQKTLRAIREAIEDDQAVDALAILAEILVRPGLSLHDLERLSELLHRMIPDVSPTDPSDPTAA